MIAIVGVDEAGRGPLAGPVVAGAAVLPPGFRTDRAGLAPLTDSKKLSAVQRAAWFDILVAETAHGIGIANIEEIAAYNILQATFLAMRRAVTELRARLRNAQIEIWVDGNRVPAFENIAPHQVKCFVGGDALHAPISAASVLAKVTRDRIMMELHARYPAYGWHQNMGYGTAAHRAAIAAHGACPEHRTLFLRKILAAA